MSQASVINYLEQGISVLKNFLNDSKVNKEEEISTALDSLSSIFDLSESRMKTIKNALEKSNLLISVKEDMKMDEADMLFLQASVLKSKVRYDKEKVNFETAEIDYVYLLDTLNKKLKSEKNKIEAAKKKEALERLKSKGLEINAENLSKEASISVEEASKYLELLNRVSKARAKNPKVN